MFIDTENTINAQASQQNTAYIDSLKIIFSALFDRNREMSGWQKSAALVAVIWYRSWHQAHRMPQTHHEPEITTRKGRYCLVGKWLIERLCSLQILTKQWSNQVVVSTLLSRTQIYIIHTIKWNGHNCLHLGGFTCVVFLCDKLFNLWSKLLIIFLLSS